MLAAAAAAAAGGGGGGGGELSRRSTGGNTSRAGTPERGGARRSVTPPRSSSRAPSRSGTPPRSTTPGGATGGGGDGGDDDEQNGGYVEQLEAELREARQQLLELGEELDVLRYRMAGGPDTSEPGSGHAGPHPDPLARGPFSVRGSSSSFRSILGGEGSHAVASQRSVMLLSGSGAPPGAGAGGPAESAGTLAMELEMERNTRLGLIQVSAAGSRDGRGGGKARLFGM